MFKISITTNSGSPVPIPICNSVHVFLIQTPQAREYAAHCARERRSPVRSFQDAQRFAHDRALQVTSRTTAAGCFAFTTCSRGPIWVVEAWRFVETFAWYLYSNAPQFRWGTSFHLTWQQSHYIAVQVFYKVFGRSLNVVSWQPIGREKRLWEQVFWQQVR